MHWAKAHRQVIFTNDLDVGTLPYLTDAMAPSVVQIRAEHIVPRVMGAAALEALSTAEDLLRAGALVTIDPRRHRVRALPLRGSTDVAETAPTERWPALWPLGPRCLGKRPTAEPFARISVFH